MSNKTPQERLAEEQKHKEHVHHTKINAAAILDHVLANMHTLHVKLHQYHWYVKGSNFYTLHEELENQYNENEKWFDKIAEALIKSGHKPASTTQEFLEYSLLKEDAADKYLSDEEMIENLIEDYRMTRGLAERAINLAAEEDDATLEDTVIEYKDYLKETIWMLQAFIGKDPYEDDDEFEDEEE